MRLNGIISIYMCKNTANTRWNKKAEMEAEKPNIVEDKEELG